MRRTIIFSIIAVLFVSGCGLVKKDNATVNPAMASLSAEAQPAKDHPVTPVAPTEKAEVKMAVETVKIYANPNDYEISYPSSWTLQTSSNNADTNVDIKKDVTAQVPDGYSQPCPANFVSVYVSGPSDYVKEYKTFDRLIAARYDEGGSLGSVSGKKEKIAINGLTAYRFEISGFESVCAGPAYFIQLNDQEYLTVYLGLDSHNKENEKVASQIAESIKRTK